MPIGKPLEYNPSNSVKPYLPRRIGNTEPSLPPRREKGVETRRRAPKFVLNGYGEGIVQTTNPASGGSSENCSGKENPVARNGCTGSTPVWGTL
ncbi:MAG: hypothetical protein SFU87_13840, partial [Chitinophagaceae bacterium]|nr:hypothetical protein [Chitinophagaceae bacterium]